mmetsp:Transcript_146936/g.409286  ORF Transcript_146936/g.409286 Transcript_146936/m.409286 type:complete len:82 (+) Transcript_146936:98-343(+)
MFLVLLLLPAVATASRMHIREPESTKQPSENATAATDAWTSDPLKLPRLLELLNPLQLHRSRSILLWDVWKSHLQHWPLHY